MRVGSYSRGLAGVLALLVLLAGCTVFPVEERVQQQVVVPPPPKQEQGAVVAAPSPGQGQGYYLDDGPPQPGGQRLALADIPDAVVRWEKIKPAHNRPYVVLDKRYVPFTELQPYRRRGMASWYGKRYHGRKTASGERYDMFQMTAAHPILPIPSYVRVTRTATGKSIVVRINDRGPFLQGREIDLSYVAAAKLDIVNAGTGEVVVEALVPPQTVRKTDAGGKIEDAAPLSEDVYIQLAAFASATQADELLARLAGQLPAAYGKRLSVYQKESDLYVVQLGPYADHNAATGDDEYLCEAHGHCGFLTKRY